MTCTTISCPGLSSSAILCPPPRPRAADLHAGEHDLIDVQEAVLLQADVDERGLQAGQDVVDLALVDVADDRAPAAALDVELSYPIAGPRFAGLLARGAGCEEDFAAPGAPVASSSATRVSARSTLTSTCFFNFSIQSYHCHV